MFCPSRLGLLYSNTNCDEQKDKPNASREHREEARVKPANVFEDKKYHVWCELVQCLDAKSVLFLRSQKGDGPAAWGKL